MDKSSLFVRTLATQRERETLKCSKKIQRRQKPLLSLANPNSQDMRGMLLSLESPSWMIFQIQTHKKAYSKVKTVTMRSMVCQKYALGRETRNGLRSKSFSRSKSASQRKKEGQRKSERESQSIQEPFSQNKEN